MGACSATRYVGKRLYVALGRPTGLESLWLKADAELVLPGTICLRKICRRGIQPLDFCARRFHMIYSPPEAGTPHLCFTPLLGRSRWVLCLILFGVRTALATASTSLIWTRQGC